LDCAVARVGHGFEHAAVSGHVIIESRIRAQRGDRDLARREIAAHAEPEQVVDAGGHDDLSDGATVRRGQRFAQFDRLGIAVP
jgi:hypothetical protein